MTLLDTNTLIYYLKGVPAVVQRLQAASPRATAIPALVAYELEYGTLKLGSRRKEAVLANVLARLVQVPFDHAAARESARLRVELEVRGAMIGPIDVLIAGTALSRGAVLATSNTNEFSRVKGLRLVDWTKT